MSKLSAIKLVAEIIDLLSGAYGKVEERRLARENKERDDKIRALEAQLAALRERDDRIRALERQLAELKERVR